MKVVFMTYRDSLQDDALKLVAKKLQSSLAVEGELPEDGLAAYGDDGEDLPAGEEDRQRGGERWVEGRRAVSRGALLQA